MTAILDQPGAILDPPDALAVGDEAGVPPARRMQRRWMCVFLVVAAVWPVVGSKAIFPYLSINHDEPVYLAQAEAISHGRFTIRNPLPGDPASVQPWFTIRRGNDFLTKYTPVFAAYLALVKRLTGAFVFGLPVLFMAGVWLMRRLASRILSPEQSLFATGAFLLSPFMLLQSALYLPYLFQLILSMIVLELACSYHHRPSRHRWQIPLLGLVVGLAVWARPVEGIIITIVAGVIIAHAHRGAKDRIVGLALAAIGGIGPIIAMLAYNQHYTGKATELPVTLFNPHDTVGWGMRSMVKSDPLVRFTLRKGIDGQIAGLRGLERFAFGGIAVGFFLVNGALRMWRNRRFNPSLAGLLGYGALTWVAYIGVWGTFFSNTGWHIGTGRVGPFYLLQLLPVVCVVTGVALLQPTRRQTTAVVAVALALTTWNLIEIVGSNNEITRIDRRLVRVVDRTPKDALIFLAFSPPVLYLQHPFQTLRNEAISGNRLFVNSSRHDVLNAIASKRKRLYQVAFSGTTPTIRSLELHRGKHMQAALQIDVPPHAGALRATVIGSGSNSSVLLDSAPEPGLRTVEFDLNSRRTLVDGQALSNPNRDLASQYLPTRLSLTVAVGDSTEVAAELRVIINREPNGTLDVLEGPGIWSSDRNPVRSYRERPGKLALSVRSFEVS